MKSASPTGIMGFPSTAVGAIPFVFPFAPLGLGLFDTDPQRLLSLLHHQSALAEEAIRYRSLLFGGESSTSSPNKSLGTTHLGGGFLPLRDDRKEPLNLHAAASAAATVTQATVANTAVGSPFDLQIEVTTKSATESTTSPRVATTIRVRDGLTKEGFCNGGGEELLLRKPAVEVGSYGMSSASRFSSTSSPLMCDPESLTLFREVHPLGGGCSVGSPTSASTSAATATTAGAKTDETKCHICMANFPSAWLLEQHAALQHPHLTIHDDKPYQCGLCGQKSRYACCRYRTVLSKHHRSEPGSRSRVPADKLFTCDVCGMQFRYLKSFKKHRLNHALERLHGKKGVVPVGPGSLDSEPAVSSTNESAGEANSSVLRSSACDMDAVETTGKEAAFGNNGHEATSGEQDDTVSNSLLKRRPPSSIGDSMHHSHVAAAECTPSTVANDDLQPKISSSSSSHSGIGGSCCNSSSNSSTSSSTSSTTIASKSAQSGGYCNNDLYSKDAANLAAPRGNHSCKARGGGTSSHTGRIVQSPMNVTGEALLAGELKLYQVASAAAAANRQATVVRSMEAESSVPLPHCIAPSTSTSVDGAAAATSGPHAAASNAPGSLGHTLNSLINAETIPHHRLLGLDPQEASILNFLRVDAAEKQRDRRFACPFCGKCVRSKENLKLHVRKHTGERPFVCLFCGRAFGGKSDLTRHLRIHTGERPYHCEACGKCFARADYLSKHLTTHVHQLSPRP